MPQKPFSPNENNVSRTMKNLAGQLDSASKEAFHHWEKADDLLSNTICSVTLLSTHRLVDR